MVLSVTVSPAHISKTFSRHWGWAVFLQKKPPSTSFPLKGLGGELQQQSLERACVQQAADGALGDLTDFCTGQRSSVCISSKAFSSAPHCYYNIHSCHSYMADLNMFI